MNNEYLIASEAKSDSQMKLEKLIELDGAWEKTQISYDQIVAKLNNEFCYKDSVNFLACVHAANSVMQANPNFRTPRIMGIQFKKLVKQYPMYFETIALPPLGHSKIKDRRAPWIQFKKSLSEVKFSELLKWDSFRNQLKIAGGAEYLSMSKMPAENNIDFEATFDWIRSLSRSWIHLAAKIIVNAVYAVYLDPYTGIDLEGHTHELLASNSKPQVGIGLKVDLWPTPYIRGVSKNSGASEAGFRSNDRLLEIKNKKFEDLTKFEFDSFILGNAGDSIPFKIDRNGTELEKWVQLKSFQDSDIEVERLSTPDSKHKLLNIHLSIFSPNACRLVTKEIENAKDDTSIAGIILDLRGNPGGDFDEALCIADLFTGDLKKILVKTKAPFENMNYQSFNYSGAEKITALPLVVLVDAMSASSSEVVTGILSSEKRAITIGIPTYGKGRVQGVFNISEPGNIFGLSLKGVESKITTGKYYFSSDESPDLRGIQPDFLVYFNLNKDIKYAPYQRSLDHYPFPSLALKNHEQPITSKQDLTAIRNCVQKMDTSPENIFRQSLANGEGADLQLLYATKVLECQL